VTSTCGCADHLQALAAQLLADADRAKRSRDRQERARAERTRNRAMGYATAAGELRRKDRAPPGPAHQPATT
jgi:hypothetical protein